MNSPSGEARARMPAFNYSRYSLAALFPRGAIPSDMRIRGNRPSGVLFVRTFCRRRQKGMHDG